MRLINIDTMSMEFFAGQKPEYAILSHTWEEEEVTFQDFLQPEKARKMKGYTKILRTCHIAREHNFNYAWVDTCCIDKTSSAELSEAINSMFKWYANSAIAIVYLGDFNKDNSEEATSLMPDGVRLSKCRWFTRGWTLQELVAPRVIHFYDSNMVFCGTKTSLEPELSRITGVPRRTLQDPKEVPFYTVAARMKWAANRETTREEDLAYSLLGIFGVNMPLLYGEGSRAFVRLQESIMADNCDLTLFAWTEVDSEQNSATAHGLRPYRGVFAHHPREFMFSLTGQSEWNAQTQFSLTNIGLKIETHLLVGPGELGLYIMPLSCFVMTEDESKEIGIYVQMVGPALYFRAYPSRLAYVQNLRPIPVKEIIIARKVPKIFKSPDYLPDSLPGVIYADIAQSWAYQRTVKVITIEKQSWMDEMRKTYVSPGELWDETCNHFVLMQGRSVVYAKRFSPINCPADHWQSRSFWVFYVCSPPNYRLAMATEETLPGISEASMKEGSLQRLVLRSYNDSDYSHCLPSTVSVRLPLMGSFNRYWIQASNISDNSVDKSGLFKVVCRIRLRLVQPPSSPKQVHDGVTSLPIRE